MSRPRIAPTPPVTARGVRTRDRLVAAARVVFEREGYLDARLVDISKEAGLSTGSFYTYFTNKEEAFAAVVEVTQNDLLHPGMGRVADEGDVHAVVEASIRAYLHACRRNARLLALLEQSRTSTPHSANWNARGTRRSTGATRGRSPICRTAVSPTPRSTRC